MSHRLAGLAGLVLAFGIAIPAQANTRDQFEINEVLENTYSCGVHETTVVHGVGTAFFDGEGNYRFSNVMFTYDGTFTETATGRSIAQKARQHVLDDGATLAFTGQGTFLRMQGEGVVLHDVGRFVIDLSDGSVVSATPKVIRFDDPDAAARIDAAVCSMFD